MTVTNRVAYYFVAFLTFNVFVVMAPGYDQNKNNLRPENFKRCTF